MESFTEIAKQAPVLALVLFFIYKNNNEWRVYLKERNGKLEKALEKFSAALDKLHERMDHGK